MYCGRDGSSRTGNARLILGMLQNRVINCGLMFLGASLWGNVVVLRSPDQQIRYGILPVNDITTSRESHT